MSSECPEETVTNTTGKQLLHLENTIDYIKLSLGTCFNFKLMISVSLKEWDLDTNCNCVNINGLWGVMR